MKARSKTQAMRLLDGRGIVYEEIVFPQEIHDALGVAVYADMPPQAVYKTLVVLAEPPTARPALILEPADAALDLKLAARGMGVKRVEMASQAEAERLSGLQVGGISALALTHLRWPVFLDRRAESLDRIVVSAGQRGRNLRLRVVDFMELTGAHWIDAAREAEARDPQP
ncbi:MAG TPA: YbaK/EbsC family protein [Anaerolineales bacterium]|nr:YbaK/EbsC family protein [Anaerolineales bacterium]